MPLYRGYEHFQNRGGAQAAWNNPRTRLALVAGFGGLGMYYFYCLETIPYSGRRHSIMLVSTSNEKVMGKQMFEEVKSVAAAEGRLLPPNHPEAQVQMRGFRVVRSAELCACDCKQGCKGSRSGSAPQKLPPDATMPQWCRAPSAARAEAGHAHRARGGARRRRRL
jgi:hypothetical protein